jgi:hypothetical protein
MPNREFPEPTDEKIFPLRKGILDYLEKPFNYLPSLLPAHT